MFTFGEDTSLLREQHNMNYIDIIDNDMKNFIHGDSRFLKTIYVMCIFMCEGLSVDD